MTKKPSKNGTPLLLHLISVLGNTNITEEYVGRENKTDIYGYLAPSGAIVINPVPHIVDTLLHELLHKLHPEYSERAVRSVVGRLMKHMTDEEMLAIYEIYKRNTDAL